MRKIHEIIASSSTPKLKPQEINEIVLSLQKKDSIELREKLITSIIPLIISICINRTKNPEKFNEFLLIAMEETLRLVNKYDITKNMSFQNYALRNINWMLLKTFGQHYHKSFIGIPEDDFKFQKIEYTERLNDDDIDYINYLVSELSEIEQDVIHYYYDEGLNDRKVSKKIGKSVSRTQAIRSISLNKLRKKHKELENISLT